MNRPTIKKILNDSALSESEKIDQIFAVYTASTSKLKTEDELQKAVEDAKKSVAGEDWKTKYDALQADLEAEKTAHAATKTGYETEKATAAKRAKLEKLLTDNGANPKYAAKIANDFKLDELKDDGDSFKDFDKHLETVKPAWADMFGTTTTTGAEVATPPTNSGGSTNYKARLEEAREKGDTIAAVKIKTEAYEKEGISLI